MAHLPEQTQEHSLSEAVSLLCDQTPLRDCNEKMQFSMIQVEKSLTGKVGPTQNLLNH